MTRRSLSFDLESSANFFAKLKTERALLGDNPTSSRHAVNTAMTAWHLWEWVWGGAVKKNWAVRRRLGVGALNRAAFRGWVLEQCPEMETMQCISEGTKHFGGTKGSRLDGTRMHRGGFSSGFSRGFDTSGGRIRLAEDGAEPYFDVELDRVIEFWERFFAEVLGVAPSDADGSAV